MLANEKEPTMEEIAAYLESWADIHRKAGRDVQAELCERYAASLKAVKSG